MAKNNIFMKNIQLIRIVILLFTLVSFNACDEAVEPIDPQLIENIETPNPDCLSPEITSGAFTSSTNVTLTWTPADGESSWQIQYGVSGFDLGSGSLTNATSNSTVITNLISTNSYDFYIRSVCSSEEFGSWWGPFTIVPPNPNCLTPSGLTVVRNAENTSATVNWTAGGTETSWQVLYVAAGFSPSVGITLPATSKPFTVSNLTNESYDFYVRAKCSDNEFSSWSAKVNLAEVSTGGTGIVGNYLLTSFTSSEPTDINADGTSSNNILSETACFNDMHLILNSNNTFVADSKGADIQIEVINNIETEVIGCFVDPDEDGTWVLNGNILTLSFPGSTDTVVYTYNSSNNTLSATENDGSIVGMTSQDEPIYLTTNLTLTYTKQ